MALENPAQFERRLHRARLIGQEPETLTSYFSDISRLIEHTPLKEEYDNISGGIGENSYLRRFPYTSYFKGIVRRFLPIIERTIPHEQVSEVHEIFTSEDPVKCLKKAREIHAYYGKHPDLVEQNPALKILLAIPPRLFLFSRGEMYVWEDIKKKQFSPQEWGEIETPLISQGKSEKSITSSERLILQMSVGWLPNMGNVLRIIREDATEEDLSPLISKIKIFAEYYGDRWEKELPNRYRTLKEELQRYEWEHENPVLDSEGQRHLTAIKKIKAFRNVASVISGYGRELSWDLFLHKIFEDSDRLYEQLQTMRLTTNHLAETFSHIDLCDEEFAISRITPLAEIFADYLGITLQPGDEEAFVREVFLNQKPAESQGIDINKEDPQGELASSYILDDKERTELGKLLELINRAEAQGLLKTGQKLERFDPSTQHGETVTKLAQVVRDILTHQTELFEESMERADEAPLDVVLSMQPGTFRDYLLYRRWEKSEDTSIEGMRRVIELMRDELGAGIEINRAQDLMNRYVKANYQDGTSREKGWRMDELIRRGYIAPEDREKVWIEMEKNFGIFPYRILNAANRYDQDEIFYRWHNERKQRIWEESEDWTPSRYLYVFTDLQKQGYSEVLTTPSYKARLVADIMNRGFEQIAPNVQETGELPPELEVLENDLYQWLGEKSLFRDFFLENMAHLEVWSFLKKSSIGHDLEKLGVELTMRMVNVADHLIGHDDGTLNAAYMITYPIIRVEGLSGIRTHLSISEKKGLADLLTDIAGEMSAVSSEILERAALFLELDYLREAYEEWRNQKLPKDWETTEAERLDAADFAFRKVLTRVTDRFPRATQHRDTILIELITDLATRAEHIQAVERLMYAYMVRHPQEEEEGKEAPYKASEAVRSYIDMFPDRGSRAAVLTFLFGGLITDDRYLESRTFQVDERERVEMFWSLSSEERKAILYDALLGKDGVFNVRTFSYLDSLAPEIGSYQDTVVVSFLEDFFSANFSPLFKPKVGSTEQEVDDQEKSKKIFHEIFLETICQYTPARRTELFISITEQMKELRDSGKELTFGEAIRILLEQVGVVGVKAGQVLSEQRDLLPDDVREDLSSLKDRATPFNKRGFISYLNTAGALNAELGDGAVSEVCELLGSASIKQVHRVVMRDGSEWAAKVQRPTIIRNFEEDMKVLGQVLNGLSREYDVPDWLMPEIRKVVEAELDFGLEAEHADQFAINLRERKPSIMLGGRRIRITTPEVGEVVIAKNKALQVMVEEYVRGLSLQNIIELQSLGTADRDGSDVIADKQRLEKSLRKLYGDRMDEMKERFLSIDIKHLRSNLGIELLYQIAQDGLFHADLHPGNIITNLEESDSQVALIDVGSAGASLVEGADNRAKFLDFASNLLLLKYGYGDSARLAENLEQFVESDVSTLEEWKERIDEVVASAETVADVYKGVLSEILKTNGKMDDNFRYLLKSLSAAGGHLQVLGDRIFEIFKKGGVFGLITSEEGQRLAPLLPYMPQVQKMAGK